MKKVVFCLFLVFILMNSAIVLAESYIHPEIVVKCTLNDQVREMNADNEKYSQVKFRVVDNSLRIQYYDEQVNAALQVLIGYDVYKQKFLNIVNDACGEQLDLGFASQQLDDWIRHANLDSDLIIELYSNEKQQQLQQNKENILLCEYEEFTVTKTWIAHYQATRNLCIQDLAVLLISLILFAVIVIYFILKKQLTSLLKLSAPKIILTIILILFLIWDYISFGPERGSILFYFSIFISAGFAIVSFAMSLLSNINILGVQLLALIISTIAGIAYLYVLSSALVYLASKIKNR
ncbi:MAG: hypothetical protein Q7S21_05150 [archaeon]|nr:hypothetical protein [archaeon]